VKNLYKILGFILIIVNGLRVCSAVYFYYQYNFTNKMFLIHLPNWMLATDFFSGLVAIYCGYLMLKKEKPLKYLIAVSLAMVLSFYLLNDLK
jgi:hypothetical protein